MGRIAKKPGTTHDDCTVVDNATGQTHPGLRRHRPGAAACWQPRAQRDEHLLGRHRLVQGSRGGRQDTTVDCQLCAPGVSDPTRGCP